MKSSSYISNIILLSFSVVSAIVNADLRNELYTEHAYLNRQEILTSLVRVRSQAPITSVLSPFLQAGSEITDGLTGVKGVDNGSYGYLAPGMMLKLGNLQFITEARFRKYYRDAIAHPLIDARQWLIYSQFMEQNLSQAINLRSFQEFYTENLYTSADQDNLISSSYLRFGLRKGIVANLYGDLFLEPYVSFDRLGHYYHNRTDAKLSLRVLSTVNTFSFSLIASVLYNQYFSYARFENNPYRDKHVGLRMLFVAGGTF